MSFDETYHEYFNYDQKADKKETTLINQFLKELCKLEDKYGIELEHEDGHGSFLYRITKTNKVYL